MSAGEAPDGIPYGLRDCRPPLELLGWQPHADFAHHLEEVRAGDAVHWCADGEGEAVGAFVWRRPIPSGELVLRAPVLSQPSAKRQPVTLSLEGADGSVQEAMTADMHMPGLGSYTWRCLPDFCPCGFASGSVNAPGRTRTWTWRYDGEEASVEYDPSREPVLRSLKDVEGGGGVALDEATAALGERWVRVESVDETGDINEGCTAPAPSLTLQRADGRWQLQQGGRTLELQRAAWLGERLVLSAVHYSDEHGIPEDQALIVSWQDRAQGTATWRLPAGWEGGVYTNRCGLDEAKPAHCLADGEEALQARAREELGLSSGSALESAALELPDGATGRILKDPERCYAVGCLGAVFIPAPECGGGLCYAGQGLELLVQLAIDDGSAALSCDGNPGRIGD